VFVCVCVGGGGCMIARTQSVRVVHKCFHDTDSTVINILFITCAKTFLCYLFTAKNMIVLSISLVENNTSSAIDWLTLH
jgi:hypothetical protein